MNDGDPAFQDEQELQLTRAFRAGRGALAGLVTPDADLRDGHVSKRNLGRGRAQQCVVPHGDAPDRSATIVQI